MKTKAACRLLLVGAAAIVLASPAAQAQIADLFGSPGDTPRSAQPVPETDRPLPVPARQASPPPGKTTRAAAPAETPATPAHQAQLVIYTTPTCPHCIRALKHMQARKIDYIQKDVQHDRANQAEFRRIGGRGVPHIVMGNTVVVGFNPQDFDRKYAAWKAQ